MAKHLLYFVDLPKKPELAQYRKAKCWNHNGEKGLNIELLPDLPPYHSYYIPDTNCSHTNCERELYVYFDRVILIKDK